MRRRVWPPKTRNNPESRAANPVLAVGTPCRRERNFLLQRRAAKNRPERPQASPEAKRAEQYRQKSPQKRPVSNRRRFRRFRRTGWWCAQSDTNRSPLQIPLLTGKNTGKNTDSDINWRVDRHKLQHPCGFFIKIPRKITGNDFEGIREKSLNNREKYIRFTDSMPSRITIRESASGLPNSHPA